MKFLKKAACCAAAAVMALSAMCTGAYAAEASQINESAVLPAAAEPTLYTVKMETEPSVPEAGKELTLSVTVDPNRGTEIKELNFTLCFNSGDYEYVPVENDNQPINTSDAGKGKIYYSRGSRFNDIKGTVLTLNFRVTNPTGKFYFDDADRIVINGSDEDISHRGKWESIEWEQCKHEKYERKVTKEPTCTTSGEMSYICTSCRVTFNSAEIPPTGHDWDRTKAVYTQSPSCTSAGSLSIPCKNKGCKDTLKETVPAMGHDWGTWTVTTPATDTQKGKETRQCRRCNATETRDVTSSILTPGPTTTTSPQVSILPTVLFDEETGVRLDFKAGVVSSGADLVVKKISQTTGSVTYDITLVRNGKTIQPSGTLYITIDLPSEVKGNSFYVYRRNSDGSYTDMLATYSSGNGFSRVSFKTGHLSEYLVTTERRDDVTNAFATNTSDSTAATVPPPATTTPAVTGGEFIFDFEDDNTGSSDTTVTPPPSSSSDTAAPPTDTGSGSGTTNTAPDVVIDNTENTGNTGNTGNAGNVTGSTGGNGSDKSEDDNVPTGILALSVPLIAAAIGIFVAKKR